MTPLEVLNYYKNLLIKQYLSKPKARGMIGAFAGEGIMSQTSVQQIVFSNTPSSGAYVLRYNGVNSASINWNDSAATIQTKLRAVAGLSQVTVSDSLEVTMVGVIPPAEMITVFSETLNVDISLTETDVLLPFAVQDGFNLLPGSDIAVGVQLDVLGKYCGVVRSGQGFSSYITLTDSDFITLIRMAISQNSAGSSLYDIQSFLHQFFPNQIFVYDYQDMTMTYVISQAVGSPDLVQLVIAQNLLPVPMAVDAASIYYVPSGKLFSFRTVDEPAVNGSPFNTAENYQLDYPWLDAHYLIST